MEINRQIQSGTRKQMRHNSYWTTTQPGNHEVSICNVSRLVSGGCHVTCCVIVSWCWTPASCSVSCVNSSCFTSTAVCTIHQQTFIIVETTITSIPVCLLQLIILQTVYNLQQSLSCHCCSHREQPATACHLCTFTADHQDTPDGSLFSNSSLDCMCSDNICFGHYDDSCYLLTYSLSLQHCFSTQNISIFEQLWLQQFLWIFLRTNAIFNQENTHSTILTTLYHMLSKYHLFLPR